MTNLVADLYASSCLYLATQMAHLAMEVLVFLGPVACIAHALLWIAWPLPLLSPPHPSIFHSPTDPLAESVGTIVLRRFLLVFQATIFSSLVLFKQRARTNLCNPLCFFRHFLHTLITLHSSEASLQKDAKCGSEMHFLS